MFVWEIFLGNFWFEGPEISFNSVYASLSGLLLFLFFFFCRWNRNSSNELLEKFSSWHRYCPTAVAAIEFVRLCGHGVCHMEDTYPYPYPCPALCPFCCALLLLLAQGVRWGQEPQAANNVEHVERDGDDDDDETDEQTSTNNKQTNK